MVLNSINRKLAKFVDYLLIFSSFALVFFIVFQILNRFIIHVSAPWTEEMARYAFVWVTMFGSAKASRTKQHISIDLIPSLYAGTKLAKVIDIISKCITMLFCIMLIITGTKWCISTGDTLLTTMNLKMIYINSIIPVGFTFMFLFELENFIADLKLETEGGNN